MSSPGTDLENEEIRSMYDIETSKLGEKLVIIHRIIYVGCLKKETENGLSVAGQIQTDIANLRDKDDETLSGLMLMFTKHFIQILECSEKMIVNVARYLSSKNKSNLVQSAKFISILHDIPQRLFKVVHISALDIQDQNLNSYQPTESVLKLIIETVTQMLKLGSQIVKLPKAEIVKCLENLHGEHPELLPQQAVLNYFLQENNKTLMSMAHFVDLHDHPFDVTFESELVWPIAPRLYPNEFMS